MVFARAVVDASIRYRQYKKVMHRRRVLNHHRLILKNRSNCVDRSFAPDFQNSRFKRIISYFGSIHLSNHSSYLIMSRIALNHTSRVKASLPAVQHALRHASSSTTSSTSSPLASTSSTPRSEIPDAATNARKSRTTHFGFREIPEEDKETMGMTLVPANGYGMWADEQLDRYSAQ